MKTKILAMNLFRTKPPSQDMNIIRRGQYLTQIYVILLFLSIFIVAIYTSFKQETITLTKNFPSKSEYLNLYNQYPITLQCHCSHLGIKYGTFITHFKPQYHPICSSIFVLSNWSETMYDKSKSSKHNSFSKDDFRLYIQTQFETISKLCSLSQDILNISIPTWLQTDFITAHVISQIQFDTQVKSLIEEFKRKLINQFIQTLKLIQIINYANQLATIYSSNWIFVSNKTQLLFNTKNILQIRDLNTAEILLEVQTLSETYGENNCSCALQSDCVKLPNFPFRTSNQSWKQTLPGFRIGCLPLDALLQSTFTCLYNQTCLDLMQTYLYYRKPIPVEILTESTLTLQNTTIETYLNQLFVVQWFENKSFDRYFNECAPHYCEYTYISKFYLFYFITTIISLFGGLKDGLYFIISYLSKVIFKLYDRRKRNQIRSFIQQQSRNNNVQMITISPITTVEVIIL